MDATRRHLVGLRGQDGARLRRLIDAARALRSEASHGALDHVLRGHAVGLLFFEPSTRTRFSFEMACHRLGAQPLVFAAESSSTSKGETVLDTARVLRALGATALVVRHRQSGLPEALAEAIDLPILNAGDGTNEHPTQALLDLVTLRDRFPRFEDVTVGIVGDLKHSRVARSGCLGLRTLGARVLLAGPPELQDPSLVELGCEQRATLADVAPDVDALMMLRIQRERLEGIAAPSATAYRERWGLTTEAAQGLRDHAIIMHPGPMNRGVEIDDAVADGPRSVILDQVANGVFARMAALLEVLGVPYEGVTARRPEPAGDRR